MAVNGRYSFWIIEQDPLIKGANARQKSVYSCAFIKMFRLLPLSLLPVIVWCHCLWKFGQQFFEDVTRRNTDGEDSCFDAMMNPRLAVSISRVSDKKGMFSQNAVKTVTHKKTITPSQSIQTIERKNIAPSASKHQEISKKQNRKYSPYRL
ncbi:hypothetical protein JTB14_013058 [Gonioctena quinquepunctata]|nr:hypothetical protein JTB14_013058 [Gonioctena quinquepunctata]